MSSASKSSKSAQRSRRIRQNKNQQGGNAATYAASVVGAPGAQMATAGQGNLLKMNGGSAVVALAPAAIVGGSALTPASMGGNVMASSALKVGGNAHMVKGGKQQNQNQNGGNVLTDLAVPAVLLYANNTIGRRGVSRSRRSSRRSSSRRRRSSRRR